MQAFAANYWLQLGATPEKVNIGLPLYGRSFTLRDRSVRGVGAAASDAGRAGRFTQENGYLAFYEVTASNPLIDSQSVNFILCVMRQKYAKFYSFLGKKLCLRCARCILTIYCSEAGGQGRRSVIISVEMWNKKKEETRKRAIAKALHLEGRTTSRQTF